MSGQNTCGAHAGMGSDLRRTALVLLERLRAAVEPLREGAEPEPGSAGACQACPVCAVVAVLRGERSELAAQLAEHATGLVAVLAAVLEADEPAAAPRPGPATRNGNGNGDGHANGNGNGYAARVPSAHGRSVQRITVHRR
ncbi:hypothetical protein [Pseudonocardia endophytica]|uniref:Uncharacterized protein n=1 Tax=Pseudonocardia endophytica TaxID=401976 RepID=A0A4R1HYA5_PSEEN|nr:hypothetical protein [Pseudonocardia endophytica]TCK25069.1 hypothetical protein EV378_0866 [Pseudonocardia endophytica]